MAKEVYKGELETLLKLGALLVDVREPDDHQRGGALPGHTHIPLSRLADLAKQDSVQNRPVVFYCRSGLMSYQAAQIASKWWSGQSIYYLSGGLLSNSDG